MLHREYLNINIGILYFFYKLQNLRNPKFEFNSLLRLEDQIRLLVLHPETINKQKHITKYYYVITGAYLDITCILIG